MRRNSISLQQSGLRCLHRAAESTTWTCMWHQVHVPISHQEVDFFSFFQISLISTSRGSSPATNTALSLFPPCLLLLLFLCLLSFCHLSLLHRYPVLCDGEITSSATGNWFLLYGRPALVPVPLSLSQRWRQVVLHTANKRKQNVSWDYCILHLMYYLYTETIYYIAYNILH